MNKNTPDNQYRIIKDTEIGVIKYKRIGDLTAEELTKAVTDPVVKDVGQTDNQMRYISNYELFNEKSAAAPFSEDMRSHNGVDLYKVGYYIKNKGKKDLVTGLLAVPVGIDSKALPLLSWQHGTTFTANEAPSGIMKDDELQAKPVGSVYEGQVRSTETLFNVQRFAGNGYVVAAADYNGLGDSKTPQYFFVDKPTTKATTGMIDAAKAILQKLGLTTIGLYLNGWSQGAGSTLFLEKNQEGKGNPITKAAHSSVTNLPVAVSYWFNEFDGDPLWLTTCIPMVIGGYQEYYDIHGLMERAIKPEYLRTAERIYEGKINWDKVGAPRNPGEGLLGLPKTGKELLTAKFLRDFNEGKGEFYKRIQENNIFTEKFTHPSRFYYGGEDYTIAPGATEEAVEFYAPMATGVLVGDEATHRSNFLGSLYGSALNPQDDIYTWFAES